jgi:hypothetical protein
MIHSDGMTVTDQPTIVHGMLKEPGASLSEIPMQTLAKLLTKHAVFAVVEKLHLENSE